MISLNEDILHEVLPYLDNGQLISLRGMNHDFLAKADQLLARHIVIRRATPSDMARAAALHAVQPFQYEEAMLVMVTPGGRRHPGLQPFPHLLIDHDLVRSFNALDDTPMELEERDFAPGGLRRRFLEQPGVPDLLKYPARSSTEQAILQRMASILKHTKDIDILGHLDDAALVGFFLIDAKTYVIFVRSFWSSEDGWDGICGLPSEDAARTVVFNVKINESAYGWYVDAEGEPFGNPAGPRLIPKAYGHNLENHVYLFDSSGDGTAALPKMTGLAFTGFKNLTLVDAVIDQRFAAISEDALGPTAESIRQSLVDYN